MKRKIINIASFILVIAIILTPIVIRGNRIQALVDSAGQVLDSNSIYFNELKIIKYSDFSTSTKKYFSEVEFDGLKTWFDAENLFKRIPNKDKYSYTEQISHTFQYEDEDYSSHCWFGCSKNIWGYKLEIIGVEISKVED